MSVDWSLTYATIGRVAQRVSQLAFLRLLQKDRAYQLEAPTLWDVDFRTAVAQIRKSVFDPWTPLARQSL